MIPGDVHYEHDRYRNLSLGYKFYDQRLNVKTISSSSEVYFKVVFVKGYAAELQHGWMSSTAKAESYNETFIETERIKTFQRFLLFNQSVGNHFNCKVTIQSEKEVIWYGGD